MLLRQVFPALCLISLQSLQTTTDQRKLESQAAFHKTSQLRTNQGVRVTTRTVERRRLSIVSPAWPTQQGPTALLQLLWIPFRRHILPNLLSLLLKGRFLEKTRVFLAAILLAIGVRIQTVQAIPSIRLPCRLAVLVVLLKIVLALMCVLLLMSAAAAWHSW